MFAAPPAQRPTSSQQQQQSGLVLAQNYPLQIDPATAAAATGQDNQSGLARLAPAETTHHAISMPSGNETMGETKTEEPTVKKGRGRKRKGDAQTEGQ
jgi:hypothetical protein